LKRFDSSLYFITDSTGFSEEEFLFRVEKALKGGVTLMQLREKEKTTVRENWYRGIVGFYQPEGYAKEPEQDVTVELLRDLLAKIEPDG